MMDVSKRDFPIFHEKGIYGCGRIPNQIIYRIYFSKLVIQKSLVNKI